MNAPSHSLARRASSSKPRARSVPITPDERGKAGFDTAADLTAVARAAARAGRSRIHDERRAAGSRGRERRVEPGVARSNDDHIGCGRQLTGFVRRRLRLTPPVRSRLKILCEQRVSVIARQLRPPSSRAGPSDSAPFPYPDCCLRPARPHAQPNCYCAIGVGWIPSP